MSLGYWKDGFDEDGPQLGMEDKMKLGAIVRDEITGFEGVAVSRTEYLFGCVSVGVQPVGLTEKGKPGDVVYFDEQRLDDASAATVGGPGDVPPPRSTPTRGGHHV